MSDIALVGHLVRSAGELPVANSRAVCRPGEEQGLTDRDFSRWQTTLKRMEPIRWDRVREAKSAMDAGEYLTPDRIDAAVNGLLRDLSD